MYYSNIASLSLLTSCLSLTAPVLAHGGNQTHSAPGHPHGGGGNGGGYYSGGSGVFVGIGGSGVSSGGYSGHGGGSKGSKGGFGGFQITMHSLPDFWVPSANIQTQKVLNLRRKPGQKSHAQQYIQALRQGAEKGIYGSGESTKNGEVKGGQGSEQPPKNGGEKDTNSSKEPAKNGGAKDANGSKEPAKNGDVKGVYGSEEVDVTDTGLVFATEVQVGGKPYEMVVDTGSADTWLPTANFQCVTIGTGDIRPQGDCGLASTYTPSPSYKALQNLNYYVQYSDGEELRGSYATETIEVAGITVKDQQFALVDTAAWNGDTATSGLLGLAFPAATKAFRGTNYIANTPASQVPYDPIFTSMYKRGGVAPLFSIALDRNEGGQLAIGGLPPVQFSPVFASSPFQLLSTFGSGQEGTGSSSAYTLYTITTGGFSYNNAKPSQWTYSTFPNPFGQPSDDTQVQVIIDTATVNIFLPQATSDAVNALFEPKPLYKTNGGLYVVECDAKPPQFGVKIGFETFYINPKDMVIKLGGQCVSAVAATGEGGTSILGEAFLKNVLAVFDVGAQMMRFAARENY